MRILEYEVKQALASIMSRLGNVRLGYLDCHRWPEL